MMEYRENGVLSRTVCEHSNAMAILTGCLFKDQQERVIERVFGRGMELDDNKSVIKVSPTFQYYAMKALAEAGREDLLMEFFEKRSGIFVNTLGLDTIPEVWDIDVRTHDSFAQATPPESNMILSEIVGLKPYEAGFADFIFEPRFDLIGRVEATMPTNVGEISVTWSCAEETCIVVLEKPDNTVSRFGAPAGWRLVETKEEGTVVTYTLKQ